MPKAIWIAAALLAALALAGGGAVIYARTAETRANEEKFAPAIAGAEAMHGLPAGLLHRQLFQESHFRTDIIDGSTVSGAGAVGIAQIVPRWHPGVDPLDPLASIDYAARYMRDLFNRFGTWSEALAAYDWGPGNVEKHGMDNLPLETFNYVTQITADARVA